MQLIAELPRNITLLSKLYNMQQIALLLLNLQVWGGGEGYILEPPLVLSAAIVHIKFALSCSSVPFELLESEGSYTLLHFTLSINRMSTKDAATEMMPSASEEKNGSAPIVQNKVVE